MPVYNEADIVGQVIEHLRKQKIDMIIADDASSDATVKICERYIQRGVLEVLKERPHERWDMRRQKARLHETARKYEPDWELVCGGDDFLESPYRGLTVNDAIKMEQDKGYNLIQFNCFEFWPTEKDPQDVMDVRKRIRYYSWNDDMQFRCWHVSSEMPIIRVDGHLPEFKQGSPLRVSPNKFVLRHYRFRSYEHGLRKVFMERLPRYSPEEREAGMHHQYDKFERDRRHFVLDSSRLTRYEEDGNWNLIRTFGGPLDFWQPESSNQRLIAMQDEIRALQAKLNKIETASGADQG